MTVFGRILSEAGYRKKRTPNGQVYGLYGTALTEKLYYEKREDLRGNYKQRIAKPVYQDGKRYAYTMKACGLLVIEHLSSPAFVPGEETGGDVPHGEENNCF